MAAWTRTPQSVPRALRKRAIPAAQALEVSIEVLVLSRWLLIVHFPFSRLLRLEDAMQILPVAVRGISSSAMKETERGRL